MSRVENRASDVKRLPGISPSPRKDKDTIETLSERLVRLQPQSEPLLRRLVTRSQRNPTYRPFAPIENGRCSACNVTVATARIQRAKAGEFINCASCITFLYYITASEPVSARRRKADSIS